MNRVSKVVVGFDFGEASRRALATAIDIADADGGELHAIYVEQPPVDVVNAFALPPPPSLQEDLTKLREIVAESVRNVIARRGKLGIKHVTVHGAIGAPASEIARFAAEVDADIVIVGSHGRRGLERAFLGSVAEKTLRLCGCPVLVVREKKHPAVDKIPEIEPPCPDCTKRRFETKGNDLWCARHSTHHPKAHVYSYEGPSSDGARPWGFT
jgi:nucleotide-binding universal stress UspA family protein